jgi:thiosulfate/3-mercaptopyruvate sulfurtransferase
MHLALAGAGVLWLAACTPAGDLPGAEVIEHGRRSGGVAESVADAPRLNSDLLVSGEWLAGKLNDPGVVVLQVGPDRAAYDQGHIPGARFLPVSEIVVERDGNANELPPVAHLDSVFEALGVSDDARVVIYGPPLPAARAFFTLDYLGHGDRTALLNGGLESWKAEGRPLSREEPQVARTSFRPRPQPERVVDAGWVAQHLDDPAVALLDARPEAQYTGAVAGVGIPRPGHIPGAGNLFWQELIVSVEHPVLVDPERLQVLFHEAGVRPGDMVVTYCQTGMQASFAYFVSRYLGYETRMYDGSFMDWSPREELPVER